MSADVASDLDDDLYRALDGAVDWLHAHLDWFSPAVWDRHLRPRAFPGGALLELLVLCRVLRRGRHRDHALLTAALDRAEEYVGSPECRDGLRRPDAVFPYRAYLLALLGEAGRSVPEERERVAVAFDTGCGDLFGTWRPGVARVEAYYVADLLDGAEPAPPDDLVAATVRADADPLSLRDDEVYALTHALFYATDFGVRNWPAPAPRRLLLTLALATLHRGDADLTGELLLCLTALGDDTPLVDRAHRWLAATRRSDGGVPGPLHDPSRHSRLDGATSEAYLFGTCHHTTMVAAMALDERERRHG